MSRRRVVRLEQKRAQSASEFRQPHPLALVGHKDHPDRFPHILLAFRPDHAAVRPHPGRKTHSPSKEGGSANHLGLARNPGSGKQSMKKGIQWKMRSSRLTMIINRM